MARDDREIAKKSGGKSLRLALLMLAVAMVVALGIGYVTREVPSTRVLMTPRTSAAMPAQPRTPHNELTYRANERGHFVIDAEVNGTGLRLLVDTGASFLSLTPKDAAAIGLSPASLRYDLRMNTAKGVARAAEVRLREVRLGQLTIEDVPAIVMEDASGISLLGMSFLNRLDGHHISNGVLTMEW